MNGKRPGGWVALAWRYFRDPRFDDVSGDAELLWCHALAYCGEQGTDGHVARGALGGLSPRLVGPPSQAAGELLTAGLWVPTGRGYRFPAWSKWQPTADQRERSRSREAERKRTRRTPSPRDSPWDTGGTDPGSPSGSPEGIGVGGEVVRSTTTSPPQRERESSEAEGPTLAGWEEFTDAAGNLYVRTTTNGQVAPNPELEP